MFKTKIKKLFTCLPENVVNKFRIFNMSFDCNTKLNYQAEIFVANDTMKHLETLDKTPLITIIALFAVYNH